MLSFCLPLFYQLSSDNTPDSTPLPTLDQPIIRRKEWSAQCHFGRWRQRWLTSGRRLAYRWLNSGKNRGWLAGGRDLSRRLANVASTCQNDAGLTTYSDVGPTAVCDMGQVCWDNVGIMDYRLATLSTLHLLLQTDGEPRPPCQVDRCNNHLPSHTGYPVSSQNTRMESCRRR